MQGSSVSERPLAGPRRSCAVRLGRVRRGRQPGPVLLQVQTKQRERCRALPPVSRFSVAPCWMHSSDRGVDRDDPVDPPGCVGLLLHLGQQLLPGAVLGPPVEPLIDRVPLPEPVRHVPPRRPGALLPSHALDSEPAIGPWPRPAGHRRHQRLHDGPYPVRDLASRHRSRLTQRRGTLLINTA